MKKENFITLVMGTVGGLLFALGMCMALLPEWDAFTPGVICGTIGAAVLLVMVLVRRRMLGKEPVKVSGKTVGIVLYAVFATLVFGTGMCMTMVWDGLLVWGIVVGIVGIVLLLGLIPLCKGLK
ncbi:MAG: hypothetical protein E7469_04505 [Ruminococcaceae bacterium]|nr:hypothetical protein [Oscillospiraceae bacterium]